ncbi:MAG: hypothetical protein R3B07_27515 [Polyangiaceae bacterium]
MTALFTPRFKRWLAAIALSGFVAGFAACKGESYDEAPPVCASAPDGQPVSPALLAFLSRARSAHHSADQLEEESPKVAIEKLQALVDGPVPGGNAPLAEASEVLADTYARLADLKSQDGSFENALKDIESGLGHAKQISYFRGHLFEVRGLVEERRAKQLEGNGDEAGAKAAKQRALEAFEQSMDIQEKVIEQNLPEQTP